MFEIRKYSADMREKVLAFLGSVFPESGKPFEPEGRHSAFSDIERNFAGFWCLFEGDDIIGTVAVKILSDTDCEVKGLYVYEKYHSMGFGRRLAETAVDFARALLSCCGTWEQDGDSSVPASLRWEGLLPLL